MTASLGKVWGNLFRSGMVIGSVTVSFKPLLGCEIQLSRLIKAFPSEEDVQKVAYMVKGMVDFDGRYYMNEEMEKVVLTFCLKQCYESCKGKQGWRENDLHSKYVSVYAFINLMRSVDYARITDIKKAEETLAITEGPNEVSCICCNKLLKFPVIINGKTYYASAPDEIPDQNNFKPMIPRGYRIDPTHLVRWLDHKTKMTDLVQAVLHEKEFLAYYHPRMIYNHPHYHVYHKRAFERCLIDGEYEMISLVDVSAINNMEGTLWTYAGVKPPCVRTPASINLPISKYIADVSEEWKWCVVVTLWCMAFQPTLNIKTKDECFGFGRKIAKELRACDAYKMFINAAAEESLLLTERVFRRYQLAELRFLEVCDVRVIPDKVYSVN